MAISETKVVSKSLSQSLSLATKSVAKLATSQLKSLSQSLTGQVSC